MITETTPKELADKIEEGLELSKLEKIAVITILRNYDSLKGGRAKKYKTEAEKTEARRKQLAQAQKNYREKVRNRKK